MANKPLQDDRPVALGELIRLLAMNDTLKVSAIQTYAAGNRQSSKWSRAPF
ncbi:MAG: hypothetical protein HQK99_00340 [Nitrospirae bacterium]|nr:hypothetical protein [Nitrospirota bacterium]